jgi:hypothetical protein
MFQLDFVTTDTLLISPAKKVNQVWCRHIAEMFSDIPHVQKFTITDEYYINPTTLYFERQKSGGVCFVGTDVIYVESSTDGEDSVADCFVDD